MCTKLCVCVCVHKSEVEGLCENDPSKVKILDKSLEGFNSLKCYSWIQGDVVTVVAGGKCVYNVYTRDCKFLAVLKSDICVEHQWNCGMRHYQAIAILMKKEKAAVIYWSTKNHRFRYLVLYRIPSNLTKYSNLTRNWFHKWRWRGVQSCCFHSWSQFPDICICIYIYTNLYIS